MALLFDILEPTVKQIKDKVFGIDFGTTNSLICSYNGSDFNFIKSSDQNQLIPSIIAIGRNKEMIFGQEALHIDDNNFIKISSIKRIIAAIAQGTEDRVIYGHQIIFIDNEAYIIVFEEKYKILDLVTRFFVFLSDIISKDSGKQIHAIVSVPAYFGSIGRSIIKKAVTNANINVLRIINEPNAAAIAYGLDMQRDGVYIVYDWGGGTLDISIIRILTGVFQVISVSGDNFLGGDDVDRAIIAFVKEKYDFDISNEISQSLKHQISNTSDIITMIYDNNTIEISQKEFENISLPLINKTLDAVHNAMFIGEQNIESITGIILVGGSTKMKIVRDTIIKKYSNLQIISHLDPQNIVAMGAALRAYDMHMDQNSILIDVVPIGIGVELVGGVIDNIIPRGAPIPFSIKHSFTTLYDNQTGIIFNIFQGDGQHSKECSKIGSFAIRGLSKMKKGDVIINVNFHMNVDNILTISASNNITNENHIISINTDNNID